jgi:hypothetical protein
VLLSRKEEDVLCRTTPAGTSPRNSRGRISAGRLMRLGFAQYTSISKSRRRARSIATIGGRDTLSRAVHASRVSGLAGWLQALRRYEEALAVDENALGARRRGVGVVGVEEAVGLRASCLWRPREHGRHRWVCVIRCGLNRAG